MVLVPYDVYINWKLTGDKRKLPCDANGRAINHLEKTNWTSSFRLSQDYGSAIVLSDDLGIACIDIDNCYTNGGVLTESKASGVREILKLFDGAAVERSQSGLGLHIYFKINPEKCSTIKNRFRIFDVEVEFYFKNRFIALGFGVERGDYNIDLTGVVLDNFPKHETQPDSHAVCGQVDQEFVKQRIEAMLDSNGSINALFGQTCHAKHLYLGTREEIIKHFPHSDGVNFDHSAADFALMNHLNYWLDNRSQDVEFAFRQSALYRKKFERQDYRAGLLSKTTQPQTHSDLLDQCKPITPEILKPIAIDDNIINLDSDSTFFDGFYYVSSLDKIFTNEGRLFNERQFCAYYGGYRFIASDDFKPQPNAWKAFTQNQLVRYPRVDKVTFTPGKPLGYTTEFDGETYVNLYKPRSIRAVSGCTEPFFDFVRRTYPDPHDQKILLSYMARCTQTPGFKSLWAPVLIGINGTGKSSFAYILQYCVDGVRHGIDSDKTKYSSVVTSDRFESTFNSWIDNKLIVLVNELHSSDWKNTRRVQDILKNLITEPVSEVEYKGFESKPVKNLCNFFFCSNHTDAVKIDENERRYAILKMPFKSKDDLLKSGLTADYFDKFWNWLRFDEGFEKCYKLFLDYQIEPEFDFAKLATVAPISSTHVDTINVANGDSFINLINEYTESNQIGFRGNMISLFRLKRACEDHDVEMPRTKALTAKLRSMGYEYNYVISRRLISEGGRFTIYSKSQTDDPYTTYLKYNSN